MDLPIVIFITLYSANVIGPTRVSRQIKDFENTFNNFLQSDFKPINPVSYGQEPNRVNIVYKPVEEPVRIEKTVPVPYVKHVPVPVPVYVPQPYPIEKKVFVPYKVYEKQHVPIIHRYPVEKLIRVPVPVPVEQPIGILVPYHVPVGKPIAEPITMHSTQSYPQLKGVPFRTKVSNSLPKTDTVVYSEDRAMLKVDKSSSVIEQDQNSISFRPFPYNVGKVVPFGTRLVTLNNVKVAEKQESRFEKESAQDSGQVQVITPAPVVENRENAPVVENRENKEEPDPILKVSNSEEVELKDGSTKVPDSNEETRKIVFPTEGNNIDDKS